MMSVLYVLRPEMFGVSEPGIICVDDQGYTYFTPTPRGKHTVLTLTPGQQDAVLRFFVRELSSKPAKYRSVSYTHLDVYKRQALKMTPPSSTLPRALGAACARSSRKGRPSLPMLPSVKQRISEKRSMPTT